MVQMAAPRMARVAVAVCMSGEVVAAGMARIVFGMGRLDGPSKKIAWYDMLAWHGVFLSMATHQVAHA